MGRSMLGEGSEPCLRQLLQVPTQSLAPDEVPTGVGVLGAVRQAGLWWGVTAGSRAEAGEPVAGKPLASRGCLATAIARLGPACRVLSLTRVISYCRNRARADLRPFTKSCLQVSLSEPLANWRRFLGVHRHKWLSLAGKKKIK